MRNSILILVLSTLLIACSKSGDSNNNGSSNPPASSQKTVSSFVFKASDNPSLPTDISGDIGTDSIQLRFLNSISRTNLIPTITISGAMISPANHTAQNFNNAVTYTITAQDGTTKNYTVKVTQTDSMGLLLGNWHVLKDSLWDSPGFGNASGGHPTPGVYIGTSVDYWNFMPGGQLTFHENNQTYTPPYQLLSNNKLSFPTTLDIDYDPANIETLTWNTFIFFWAKTNPNGERYFHKVWLYK